MANPILPVKVVESADLEENGGVYLVKKGVPAVPVHGFTAQGNRAVKGIARPVYVVSDAEFNAGDFVKGHGQPRPVGDIDDLGFVGALEGREAIPVWAVNDWPASSISPAQAYINKVLAYAPIAYWPLTELSGTVADNAEGTAARDGTYNGVTLNSVDGPVAGERAGRWDGTNDYCNIYSASLNTPFNGQLFSVSAWVKVVASSVWTDGVTRRAIILTVNGSNFFEIRKNSSANMLSWIYRAGGVSEQVDLGSISPTGWVHVGFTISKAADEVRAYYAGAQTGATQTALGSWSGSLAATGCVVGAGNTTPVNVLNGYMAHVGIFGSALSAVAMADLATV